MSETSPEPGTEIAVRTTDETLGGRLQYAQALANADLLPTAYRRKPANVLLAMEYGHALGLNTITAIQQVHIVEGKPTASAQLIGSLVRMAGHRLRVSVANGRAVAEIIRRDDPEFVFRSEWTMARAQQAGLTSKGVWKSYPEAMLKARAITEVARDACPEVLAGVAYTAEELGDDGPTSWPTETSTGVGSVAAPAESTGASAGPAETPAPVPDNPWADPHTGEIIDAETVPFPDEPEPAATPMATAAQLKMLGVLFGKCGRDQREDRLHATAKIVGREVGSASMLTKAEASDLITVLKACSEDAEPVEALTRELSQVTS